MKRIGKESRRAGDGEKTDDGGYTAARLSVCLWAVLIVRANANLIGNRLLHSLKRRAVSDGHNSNLGRKEQFCRANNFRYFTLLV